MRKMFVSSLALLLLLSGCSSSAPSETASNETTTVNVEDKTDVVVNIKDVAKRIVDECTNKDVMTELESDVIASYIYADSSIIEDSVAYVSTSSECADTVVIVKTSNSDQLQSALKNFASNTKSQFESYFPDEAPKFDDAIIVAKGTYVYLVVCNDYAKAQSIIDEN